MIRLTLPSPWRNAVGLAAIALSSCLPLIGGESKQTQDSRAAAAHLKSAYTERIQPLLATYCIRCHGGDKVKGDIDFAMLNSADNAVKERLLWEKAANEMRHGDMPPAKERQPTPEEKKAITEWVTALRRLEKPDPGRVSFRRLNRAEYNNTIRDLLGIDVRPASAFPPDDVGHGFDNMADILSLSPLLMEKYLLAADDILEQVVSDDQIKINFSASELPATISGKPEKGSPVMVDRADKEAYRAARSRTLVGYDEIDATFTALKEGKFTMKVRVGAEQAGTEPAKLEVRVDGQSIGELRVTSGIKNPAQMSVKFDLAPGKRRVSLYFANPFSEAMPDAQPGGGAQPQKPSPGNKKTKDAGPRTRSITVEEIEIIGPPGERVTELHKKLFVAVPSKDLDAKSAAQQIAQQLASRAYRRPATKDQIDLLLRVFDLANAQGETFSESVKLMVKAVLISPEFFYRVEEDRSADSDGIYRLDAWELASRLSYFIWSSMPDEALFAAAKDGSLLESTVLETQVKRMIADPKARALVENFAGQWMRLRAIFEITPDTKRFPELTKDLRQAMYDEGAMLFESVLRDGRSMIDFIDCDYTFLNDRLARHYGIPGITGSQMRKVTLTERTRGGFLTMGALLAVTSYPTRTSPVKRGKFILDEILGAPPPPPPPMVEALDKDGDSSAKGLSLRQRMERHRADAACASCHTVMDAIGFGLENFDPIGRWRDKDAESGASIDATGELPGSQRFSSPAELKKLLLVRHDEFCRTLTERLLTYALGRKVGLGDLDAVDTITAAVAQDDYRLDRLVIAIAQSFPFQYRRLPR